MGARGWVDEGVGISPVVALLAATLGEPGARRGDWHHQGSSNACHAHPHQLRCWVTRLNELRFWRGWRIRRREVVWTIMEVGRNLEATEPPAPPLLQPTVSSCTTTSAVCHQSHQDRHRHIYSHNHDSCTFAGLRAHLDRWQSKILSREAAAAPKVQEPENDYGHRNQRESPQPQQALGLLGAESERGSQGGGLWALAGRGGQA